MAILANEFVCLSRAPEHHYLNATSLSSRHHSISIPFHIPFRIPHFVVTAKYVGRGPYCPVHYASILYLATHIQATRMWGEGAIAPCTLCQHPISGYPYPGHTNVGGGGHRALPASYIWLPISRPHRCGGRGPSRPVHYASILYLATHIQATHMWGEGAIAPCTMCQHFKLKVQ